METIEKSNLYLEGETFNPFFNCDDEFLTVGPNADLFRVKGPITSKYFKELLSKVDIITNALIGNNMYVGSKKIECMILNKDGQLVMFSNANTGSTCYVSLIAYYPYMDGDTLRVIETVRTTIPSPKMLEYKAKADEKFYSPTPAATSPNVMIGRPNVIRQYPYPTANTSLNVYDYANGFCNSMSTPYEPICIWFLNTLDRFTDNAAELRRVLSKPCWFMPEKVALRLLEGKPLPLIFAGCVHEEKPETKPEENSDN